MPTRATTSPSTPATKRRWGCPGKGYEVVELSQGDVERAIIGGMLLSAGGSGKARVEKDRTFGELACRGRPVSLISLEELGRDHEIMVASGVGAPGGAKSFVSPDHSRAASEELVRAIGHAPDAVMPGHVPGMYAWLAAASLSVPLLDAACNGRGHPTVKMGSLGLSSRPDVRLFQSGVGDNVSVTVNGNALVTSALMRAAAVQNGGVMNGRRRPGGGGVVLLGRAR